MPFAGGRRSVGLSKLLPSSVPVRPWRQQEGAPPYMTLSKLAFRSSKARCSSRVHCQTSLFLKRRVSWAAWRAYSCWDCVQSLESSWLCLGRMIYSNPRMLWYWQGLGRAVPGDHMTNTRHFFETDRSTSEVLDRGLHCKLRQGTWCDHTVVFEATSVQYDVIIVHKGYSLLYLTTLLDWNSSGVLQNPKDTREDWQGPSGVMKVDVSAPPGSVASF